MKHFILVFSHLAILLAAHSLNAQDSGSLEPEEALTWNLSEYEAETGAKWITTQFPTIKGALYTLAASSDLENWTPVQSFYAVGHDLHLALYEVEPAPPLAGGGTTAPPAPAPPVTSVSFLVRSLPNNTGIAVTWRTLDEENAGEVIRQVIPVSLDQAWETIPFFIDKFDSHLVFISALVSHPAPADFTATTLETGTPDELAFVALQSNFATIQQTVVTNYTNWQNNPVPPPAPTGGQGFYRLERTFPDTDGDGMSDAFEYSNGSDANNADEDNNGTPDGDDDSDGDGLTNEDEELMKTDPNKTDTNEDGIPDGATHEWFILHRTYSFQFEKIEPGNGEPDTSNGSFSFFGSWDEQLSGEGELTEPHPFDSLGGVLAADVPFDNQFLTGPSNLLSDTDDPLGTSGFAG